MTAHVIDYLRISVTDRCNFRCGYCMPPEGVEYRSHRDILSFEEIAAFTEAAVAAGVTRVRITGGEPLVRRECTVLVSRLASLPGVEDLSLTTNGSLLAAHAARLRAAGLSRINISIDSLDPARFSRITRCGSLGNVLEGLDAALDSGFDPVKVNVVMLAGIEEEVEDFVRLTRNKPIHVRFIESMPIGRPHVRSWSFVSRRSLQNRLTAMGDLTAAESPVGAGPARYFRFDNHKGTIGFISSMSDHFCADCNRLRLTAEGKLRNCLFSGEEIDIRRHVDGDPDDLIQIIRDSMNAKRFDRRGSHPGLRTMSQIGG